MHHESVQGRELGVFGYEVLNFRRVTSDVQTLIRRTKHELIIKLTAEPLY